MTATSWSSHASSEPSVVLKKQNQKSVLVRVSSRLRRFFRRSTSFMRVLPDFLIVGAQKAGTTSLHSYLEGHSDLYAPQGRKELHFFDRYWESGVGHYKSWFPTAIEQRLTARRSGAPSLCFETTPEYMLYPETRERMHEVLGPVPLVILLRDPIDRFWSAFKMYQSRWMLSASVEELLEADPALAKHEGRTPDPSLAVHSAFISKERPLTRGLYAEQLKGLYEFWPRDRVQIFDFAELTQDPRAVCTRVLSSFNLPPLDRESWPTLNKGDGDGFPEHHRARLQSFFKEPNEELAALLGWTPSWMRQEP